MTKAQQDFFNLGKQEAKEKKCIVLFCKSIKANELLDNYTKGLTAAKGFTFTTRAIRAFNNGVAEEINEQLKSII